jgi:hypothetical protein
VQAGQRRAPHGTEAAPRRQERRAHHRGAAREKTSAHAELGARAPETEDEVAEERPQESAAPERPQVQRL